MPTPAPAYGWNFGFRCESQYEVRHERARNPSSHVALRYSVTKAISQGEVSATAKAIVV
jgi:hypothetical protein